MRRMSQGQERVYIEQVRHGKSAMSALTCSEETIAVPAGASMTGRPVNGSFVIR
jgi:hypothetical protein